MRHASILRCWCCSDEFVYGDGFSAMSEARSKFPILEDMARGDNMYRDLLNDLYQSKDF